MISMGRIKDMLLRGGSESLNGALVGLSLAGLIAIKAEIETNKLREEAAKATIAAKVPKGLSPGIRTKIIDEIGRACVGLGSQKVPFSKNIFTGADAERVLRLEGYKSTLSCVELLLAEPQPSDDVLRKVVTNYGPLCGQINNGFLQYESTSFRLLWRSFFTSLKEKLCQPEILERLEIIKKDPSFPVDSVQVDNVIELLKILQDEERSRKLFSVFKSKTEAEPKTLQIFCVQVFDSVVNNDKNFQRVINYTLSKRAQLRDGSRLKNVFEEVQRNLKKSPTVEDALVIKTGLLRNLTGTICTSEEGMKQIKERGDLLFPIFKEIAELLVQDSSAEAREIERVFLAIFKQMKDF